MLKYASKISKRLNEYKNSEINIQITNNMYMIIKYNK